MRKIIDIKDTELVSDDQLRRIVEDILEHLDLEYVETNETRWASKNDTTEKIVLEKNGTSTYHG